LPDIRHYPFWHGLGDSAGALFLHGPQQAVGLLDSVPLELQGLSVELAATYNGRVTYAGYGGYRECQQNDAPHCRSPFNRSETRISTPPKPH
jgi:hypothetical protein